MTDTRPCSWHPSRDGFGDVLGPELPDGGFPWLAWGMKLDAAKAKYGEDIVVFDQRIPVVVAFHP